ncbi:cell wall hydrolase [Heliomicrobium undosum]|nr:cell wall hydrolase [Heliomicrobium undosum]
MRYCNAFFAILLTAAFALAGWQGVNHPLSGAPCGFSAWKAGGDAKAVWNLPAAEAETGRGYPKRGDETMLARAIHGEARGEPYEGQVAVGAVIINRAKHASFPNSVHGVIFQPGAFTAVDDGQIWTPLNPTDSANKAARDALAGWDPTGGCIYYWNPATATSRWIWSRPVVKQIGKHYFAK